VTAVAVLPLPAAAVGLRPGVALGWAGLLAAAAAAPPLLLAGGVTLGPPAAVVGLAVSCDTGWTESLVQRVAASASNASAAPARREAMQ
jgi:hypothetical protein